MSIENEIADAEQKLAELREKKRKQEREALKVRGEFAHAYYRPERDAWAVRMSTPELEHIRQVETREDAEYWVALADKIARVVITNAIATASNN